MVICIYFPFEKSIIVYIFLFFYQRSYLLFYELFDINEKKIYISIETIQYLWYNNTREKKEKKSRIKEEYLKTLVTINLW